MQIEAKTKDPSFQVNVSRLIIDEARIRMSDGCCVG